MWAIGLLSIHMAMAVDSDGDSVDDLLEDVNGNGDLYDDDTDANGVPNFLDPDDDGDGIPTWTELAVPASWRDRDGDGTLNHLDLDADEDGFSDLEEWDLGYADADGDGAYDFLDFDSDADRVPDLFELHQDSDLDGWPNRLDADDDGDTVATVAEESETLDGDPRNDDWDGDTIPDYLDADDDNDGLLTRLEGMGDPLANSDAFAPNHGDLLVDYLDADDDNDGVPTLFELDMAVDPPYRHTNGVALPLGRNLTNQIPDHLDFDDDGDALDTWLELDPAQLPTAVFPWGVATPLNTDGDLLFDYLDVDDDGDGAETLCEVIFSTDYHGVDTDGDGLLDGEEWFNPLWDFELGVPASVPTLYSYDQALDRPEAIAFAQGVLLASDANEPSGGHCLVPWDRDGNGTINALDIDDDGDGLPSFLEGRVEVDCAEGDPDLLDPDGIFSAFDFDSDNDGVWDGVADTDVDGDQVPDVLFGFDLDGDGVDDPVEGTEDRDATGVSDWKECPRDPCELDSDVDGVKDCLELCPQVLGLANDWCWYNPDTDADGVIDGVEYGTAYLTSGDLQDTDADGVPDYQDDDDDGDGVPTRLENQIPCDLAVPLVPEFVVSGGGYWAFSCQDSAGQRYVADFGGNTLEDYPNTDMGPQVDGLPVSPDDVPDFLDDDDDGDGRPTATEGAGDVDCDGVADYLDLFDEDDDCDPGAETGLPVDTGELGDTGFVDSDGDGVPDDIDPDPNSAGGGEEPPAPTAYKSGCGCAQGGGLAGLWAALPVLWGLRRRREPAGAS